MVKYKVIVIEISVGGLLFIVLYVDGVLVSCNFDKVIIIEYGKV